MTLRTKRRTNLLVAVIAVDIVLALAAGFLGFTAYSATSMRPFHVYSTCGSVAVTYGAHTTRFPEAELSGGTVNVPVHSDVTVRLESASCRLLSWSTSGSGIRTDTNAGGLVVHDVTNDTTVVAVATRAS